jgi:hypothetical protein
MSNVHFNNKKVIVTYTVKNAELAITEAEYRLINEQPALKVPMIEFIRAQYGLGFYEARQVVDAIQAPKPSDPQF